MHPGTEVSTTTTTYPMTSLKFHNHCMQPRAFHHLDKHSHVAL